MTAVGSSTYALKNDHSVFLVITYTIDPPLDITKNWYPYIQPETMPRTDMCGPSILNKRCRRRVEPKKKKRRTEGKRGMQPP